MTTLKVPTIETSYRVELRHQYGLDFQIEHGPDGQPLTKQLAETLAATLDRVAWREHNVRTVKLAAQPATREQVWKWLIAALSSLWNHTLPMPQDITVDEVWNRLTVKLPDAERGQVDAWASGLGLGPCALTSVPGPGATHPMSTYGVEGALEQVPGWEVEIECALRLYVGPAEHGGPAEWGRDQVVDEPAAETPEPEKICDGCGRPWALLITNQAQHDEGCEPTAAATAVEWRSFDEASSPAGPDAAQVMAAVLTPDAPELPADIGPQDTTAHADGLVDAGVEADVVDEFLGGAA